MKTICPHCNQEYPDIPDDYLGSTCECAACHKDFVVEKVVYCVQCSIANAKQAPCCRGCGRKFGGKILPRGPILKPMKDERLPPSGPAYKQKPQETVRKPSGPPEKKGKRGIWDLVWVILCIVGLCIYHANKADKWKKSSSPPAKQADHQPGGKYMKNTVVAGDGGKADFEKGERYLQAGNREEAVRWYRKAAEKKHAQAEFHLGMSYLAGQGVTKDPNEGIKWLRRAAEHGDASQKSAVGFILCQINLRQEGIQWIRKAAEQGDEDAKKWLSLNDVSTKLQRSTEELERLRKSWR